MNLATLAANPALLVEVRPEEIPELVGQAAALHAALLARLVATASAPTPAPTPASQADRLLTIQEVAARVGTSPRWFYRNADRLPFTRRLNARTLRFSERGLTRWLESRR